MSDYVNSAIPSNVVVPSSISPEIARNFSDVAMHQLSNLLLSKFKIQQQDRTEVHSNHNQGQFLVRHPLL